MDGKHLAQSCEAGLARCFETSIQTTHFMLRVLFDVRHWYNQDFPAGCSRADARIWVLFHRTPKLHTAHVTISTSPGVYENLKAQLEGHCCKLECGRR